MGSDPGTLVLIADDERPIADLLAEIVEEAGYRPLVARDGRQALELTRARRPALVITDLMMPVLDGAALIAALRDEAASAGRPATPVILMTAVGRGGARHVAPDALLPKPFDLAEVLLLLRHFLEGVSNGAAPADAARATVESWPKALPG